MPQYRTGRPLTPDDIMRDTDDAVNTTTAISGGGRVTPLTPEDIELAHARAAQPPKRKIGRYIATSLTLVAAWALFATSVLMVIVKGGFFTRLSPTTTIAVAVALLILAAVIAVISGKGRFAALGVTFLTLTLATAFYVIALIVAYILT